MAKTRIWPSEPRPWGAYWRDHGRVLRDTLGYLSGRFATTLWVWLTIGVALAVPATLYLLEANLARTAGQWRENPGFSVYFEAGVALEGPRGLGRSGWRPWMASNASGSPRPTQPLPSFRDLSGVSDALELLDDNPLPASVRATVTTDVSPGRLAILAEQAAEADGVEDVVVERSWLERLGALREIVIRLYWSMTAILGPRRRPDRRGDGSPGHRGPLGAKSRCSRWSAPAPDTCVGRFSTWGPPTDWEAR